MTGGLASSLELELEAGGGGIGFGDVVGIGADGGVASGLGLDDAVGAPRPGPFELHGSVGGFLVDDQHTAKDETEGVGDDGGAAGGDASPGEEHDEVGESRVDFLRRLKGRDGFPENLGGDVGNVGDGVSSSTYTVGVSIDACSGCSNKYDFGTTKRLKA